MGFMASTFSIPATLRLMRVHQPVGIWLVFWPCAWALLLASPVIPYKLLSIFAVGAVLMRSAGCIINDMADRKFDREVERTKNRPLASGELTLQQASFALILLLTLAACLLFFLPSRIIPLTFPALGLIFAYPFMKRITWWPQAFLGLTFNWGALIAWSAASPTVSFSAYAIYAAGIFWTLGYDTIYGHQDKRDDARIGVKSTSLKLGNHTKRFLYVCYGLTAVCLLLAILESGHHQKAYFIMGWLLFTCHLIWQIRVVDLESPASCLTIFKSNTWAGGWCLIYCISTITLL